MTDSEIRKLCEEFEKSMQAIWLELPEPVARDHSQKVNNYVSLLRSKLEGERWIPVSEKLPMNGVHVLFMAIDDEAEFGYRMNGCWRGWTHDYMDDHVTHWRPLPSSPEVMG